MSLVHVHLRAFCDAICKAACAGDPFDKIREQVCGFVAEPWPGETADNAVRDYLTTVPNHILACTDLDFQKFSASTPLHIDNQRPPLHLHHILEAFSRTNPQQYGAIWLPLLDVAEAVADPNASHRSGLTRARMHLQSQVPTNPFVQHLLEQEDAAHTPQGVDPSAALDGVMRNILQA